MLHFAPEQWFQQQFLKLPNLDYISTDLEAPHAMVKMDITRITYPDDSFDVILCNHVLEHIPDDLKAMRELHRVLKPGGWAILQVPLEPDLDVTYEDPSIVDPEERFKAFKQQDHVRLYGRDFKDRLENSGFHVTVDDYVRQFSKEEIDRYGLMESEDIYFCTKS
jgi:SAM-dependent methyltransferase